MTPLTFTIDLEDASGAYTSSGRYIDMTGRLLSLCQDTRTKGTFFTVGKVARVAPALIKRIAAQGHEIAYHSHAHLPLNIETPDRFTQQTHDDKDLIEQLTGVPLLGFRAPGFSLTPQTRWATDILSDLGFLYSSSIMPTNLSRFGFAQAPNTPFTWPSGLIEFPLPMAKFGKVSIPFSGGIYLYCWPSFIVNAFMRHAGPQEILWTYTHPQDFDINESYKPLPHTPNWMSIILWYMRSHSEKKIRSMLATYQHGAPLGQIAKRLLTETTLPVLPAK